MGVQTAIFTLLQQPNTIKEAVKLQEKSGVKDFPWLRTCQTVTLPS